MQIIDGQQRITTSLVLISTIRDLANKLVHRFPTTKINGMDPIGKKLDIMMPELNKMLLKDKEPTLKIQKSQAEKQEQKYADFFNWIITKRGIGSKYTDKNYKPIKLLRRVRRTLQRTLSHKIRYSSSNPNALNSLKDQISALFNIYNAFTKNFYVVVLDALNRSEALTIYMTLNNRGKDLSTADIVKGHLAGILEDNGKNGQIPKIMHKWNSMSTTLNSDTSIISHFIGEYWAASHNYASGSQLSRAIINQIISPQDVIDMVNELLDLVPVYSTLRNPIINGVYNNQKLINNIATLNCLRLVQYYPVLLAMYHHRDRFNENNILKIMHTINSIEMRHLIHSVHHTKYEEVSNKIWHNNLYSTEDIIDWMNHHQLVDNNTTKNGCLSYSHKLTKSGSGLKTLTLMLAKEYAYQNKHDFNNGASIYNDIFHDQYKFYVTHLNRDIDAQYSDYIGNYVLLEAYLYKEYIKEPTLPHLRTCLNKSNLITNHKLANKIDDYIHNNDDITNLVLNRQRTFANNYVQIWN